MIVVVQGPEAAEPRRLSIAKAEILIGKHSDCDVVLPSGKVSRRHARVAVNDGGLLIEDLRSTNGTLVNGEAVSGTRPLRDSDEVRIADFVLRIARGESTSTDRTLVKEPAASPSAADPASATPASVPPAAPVAASATIAVPASAPSAPTIPPTKAKEKPEAKPKEKPETEEVKKAKMFWASMESFFQPIWGYIEDAGVSEIMINGPQEIFFEQKGKLVRSEIFFSEEGLRAAIMNVAQFMGRRINEENPYLDARLPDGSRVAIVLPPCSRKGPCIAIRKFAKERMTLQDLVKFGALSDEVVQFLDICVKLRKNAIVSGGTSSGKTTLLNIVSALIPNDQRIIVIEDSAELQLQQEHVLPLESKPPDKHGKGEVTLRELVRASLRLRPDRIVVGEVRGGEALDLLQAMNTGHSGSLATIHASSPAQTLARLETLTLFSGLDLPIVAIREQVASAVDMIIQAARLQDGSRKVTHISQVLPLSTEGRYRVQDIFRFVRTGTDGGKIQGEHRAVGNLPTFLDEIELSGFELPPSLKELAARPEVRAAIEHKDAAH
jgi:pilus assembly protein CpaF